MASTRRGHVAINGLECVLVDKTYRKQTQTAFNSRFSTGDPSYGDLSFFQYLAMEDFSGGNGQETFLINNRFWDSDGVDVTEEKELKLAPKLKHLASINGPQAEHIQLPIEQEDAWPQIIEWLGKAVIYNDKIEHDAGGVELLEVFETEVLKDKVIEKDTSGLPGTISNQSRAEIISIDKVSGLPGDVIKVTVKFKKPKFEVYQEGVIQSPIGAGLEDFWIDFRLFFGGDTFNNSDYFAQERGGSPYNQSLFTITATGPSHWTTLKYDYDLDQDVTVVFSMIVPDVSPGIYNLITSAGTEGSHQRRKDGTVSSDVNEIDTASHASVQFFVEAIDEVLVERKNLYAPQLKGATVSGSKLVGGRVYDSVGYIEVYEEQNEAVDRTLQINLSDAGATPAAPTYMEMISRKGTIIAALDNRIYAFDIETSGLTDAQRTTFIGTVAGDYVSGMELWNQRAYIASFDKSRFTSHVAWTDGTEIEDAYDIDGKFRITDLVNFQGALLYSGGTQDKVGEVRAFPSEPIIEVEHPVYDSTIRALNAGRHLYAGWSHGIGIIAITNRGPSTWAKIEPDSESPANVVWDIEEVGDKVYVLADSKILETTDRFVSNGFMETSKMGGNTPLIDKDWDSVTIEFEELKGGQKIKVLATSSEALGSQWSTLGEVTEQNITQKTFFFPEDYAAHWAQVRIELSTENDTQSPLIKTLLVKYIPSSLQKLQWTFAIRADNNLRLLNGERDKRTGAEIAEDLFNLREFGKLTFRDVDEAFYTVVITDIKQESPLIDKERGVEGIVAVEILEA